MSFRPKEKTVLDPSLQLGMTGSARHLASLRFGGEISSFAHVPFFVQRPAFALQARRPTPLMVAAGAAATCGERIPTLAAAIGKIFWMTTRPAEPAVRRFRLPFAEWAANASEIRSLAS